MLTHNYSYEATLADSVKVNWQVSDLIGGDKSKLICAVSAEKIDPMIYLSNIETSRRYCTVGQFTWHFGELSDDFGGLKAGPYAQPATYPPLGTNRSAARFEP